MTKSQSSKGNWSYCAEQVRLADPDAFLIALLLPKAKREDMISLLAFNTEISKVSRVVSQPMLGQIRLTWWREALDQIYASGGNPKQVRQHEVVTAMTKPCQHVPRSLLEGMIDAREQDLDVEPFPSIDALEAYLAASIGNLLRALQHLDPTKHNTENERSLNHLGVAWGLVETIKKVPHPTALKPKLLAAEISPQDLYSIALDHLAKAGKPKNPVAILYTKATQTYLKAFAKADFQPHSPLIQNRPPSLAFQLWLASIRGKFS